MTACGGRPLGGRSGIGFIDELAAFADNPALLTNDDVVSYARLRERVDKAAARLGGTRRLVLLRASNTIDSVVSYLGALRGGHPVILADAARPELTVALTSRFDPDVIMTEGECTQRRPGTRHQLHPQLAVLLSTSGSTGSPKLVRLSQRNLHSNAERTGWSGRSARTN